MARCCGNSCSCKIEAGSRITITGIGSSGDPFVINSDTTLEVVDTSQFNLVLNGAGTTASPWSLQAFYASTATLRSIPDVSAASNPTNGHVLGWDTTLQKWTPRAPTTAASGSVQHDTSLSGDGSGGSPLQIVEATNGYLETVAGGVQITTAGKNQMVRKFANEAARTAASPAPTTNTLSALDTVPGVVDYWTGSQWLPVKGAVSVDAVDAQLLSLSGAYAANLPVTMLVRQFTGVTSPEGILTIIPNALISTRAGVLSVNVTVTGAQPYLPTVIPATTRIDLLARRIDDGAVLAGQSITGQVTAYVY
jgi:hypothetical protein